MARKTILRIDASARRSGSVSRDLSADLASRLAGEDGTLIVRDLAENPLTQVDEAWVGANFTPEDSRTDEQRQALSGSDSLVGELFAADEIVIGVPVYNFAIPASLKAWVDQIARARKTFRYTENGPQGLLKGKTAWLVVASGGTAIGSEIDFATPYLKFILDFVGITDVRIVDATKWGTRSEAEQAAVREKLDQAAREAA